MSNTVDKKWFAQMMGVIRAGYPNMFNAAEGPWRATMQTFYTKLSMRPKKALMRAAVASHDRFPDRFPTLGQFTQVVDTFTKEQRSLEYQPPSGGYLPPAEESSLNSYAKRFRPFIEKVDREYEFYKKNPDKRPDDYGDMFFKELQKLWDAK